MSWIALTDGIDGRFDPTGIEQDTGGTPQVPTGPDALMVRGSLVVEICASYTEWRRPLLEYWRGGDWPFALNIVPDTKGQLQFTMLQSGRTMTCTLPCPDAASCDWLRLTYSWDAPRRSARVAVEDVGSDRVHLVQMPAPLPLQIRDIAALVTPGRCTFHPDVAYLGISTRIEPVGPAPSLAPWTRIATPDGHRPVEQLRNGDLVLTACGGAVPILATLERQVPARGSFVPLEIHPPYFGLTQAITLATFQRLFVGGTDVEYLFGHERVLVSAAHLPRASFSTANAPGWTARYRQLLLPRHARLLATGTELESLYIGGLTHRRDKVAASLFAGDGNDRLPDHGAPACAVLDRFAAEILADSRAA